MKRFWNKVNKNSGHFGIDGTYPTECHEWTGSLNRTGYGQFKLNNKVHRAHRVAFYLKNNKWPSKHLCHDCDNPACIRLDHMFEGSNKDNMVDKEKKGRGNHPNGQDTSFALFTDEEIILLRELYEVGFSGKRIARVLGIHAPPLYAILNGRTYKESGGPIRDRGVRYWKNGKGAGTTGVSNNESENRV